MDNYFFIGLLSLILLTNNTQIYNKRQNHRQTAHLLAMLKKSDIKRIKKVLGKKYSTKLLAYFKEKGYRRASGKDFVPQDIFNFFSGRYDLSMHIKIIEAVEHYEALANELAAKTQMINKKEKPEALTPGL